MGQQSSAMAGGQPGISPPSGQQQIPRQPGQGPQGQLMPAPPGGFSGGNPMMTTGVYHGNPNQPPASGPQMDPTRLATAMQAAMKARAAQGTSPAERMAQLSGIGAGSPAAMQQVFQRMNASPGQAFMMAQNQGMQPR